jgi:beta-mannosidase
MAVDLLEGSVWDCRATPPGQASSPEEVDRVRDGQWPAVVPGTAAGALRDAGDLSWMERDFDGSDWWFRTTFVLPADQTGPWLLTLGGVATVADAWLNGQHCWHGENMFAEQQVAIAPDRAHNELVIRCQALAPLVARRRPRAGWRTRLVDHQHLRWFRTTLLGRMPGWAGRAAPVGPWRPVTVTSVAPADLISRHLVARCSGEGGAVELSAQVRGLLPSATPASLWVGDVRAELLVTPGVTSTLLSGTVHLPTVDRWWPHTHGAQPLYPLTVEVDGQSHRLGKVGFRTVEVDRRHDGFSVEINGVPVFCRGACWVPPDPVSLVSSPEEVDRTLGLLVEGNLNMIRVPGTMTYESDAFLDACDALGILVWQDCMLANMEPPDDDEFRSELDTELRQVLSRLQGRPCLTVVSGGSEIEQQAAMMGVEAEAWTPALLTKTIPDLVTQQLPGIPYVPSSPTGGSPPFRVDTGVAHYFGVGAYQRPLDDIRRSDVRFAAECLAFATPPEPELVEAVYGDAAAAGHAPVWKQAVPRDAGASWDFEDVTSYYVRQLFGDDPALLRYADPERALALSRAAVVECVTATFSEWRRAGSRCSGGLVLAGECSTPPGSPRHPGMPCAGPGRPSRCWPPTKDSTASGCMCAMTPGQRWTPPFGSSCLPMVRCPWPPRSARSRSAPGGWRRSIPSPCSVASGT